MTRGTHSFTLSAAFVLLAAWTLLGVAACFPAGPTATPPPVAAPAQAATPTARLLPTPTPVPPTPTQAPAQATTQATAQPPATLVPVTPPAEVAPADGGSTAESDAEADSSSPVFNNPVFNNLALLEERAFSYLSELAVDVGVRTSGTPLEEEAAHFLAGRLEDLGYTPEMQEFTWGSPEASLGTTLSGMATLEPDILNGTATGEATGELAFVGLAKPEDIPESGLEGKVALIERGEITFGSKVAAVHRAGAVAAIIYNNVPGNFQGTLGGRSQIPAVSISQADGGRLREFVEQGEAVEATVVVEDSNLPSRNVIAELPGTEEGVIVIGAHYDTVADSVGASDNSSGMGALLAVAEQISGRSFPFTVRFIAFGAEETGLYGSEYYVESLSAEGLEEIYLMVNLDSVGSGSHLRLSGDRWAANHVKETADREGISLALSRRSGRGGSDHASFRNAWVPVLFFYSDDLSRINSPADTMEHINSSLLGDATALVLDLLENVDQLPGYGQ